jgi:hypothetical protein
MNMASKKPGSQKPIPEEKIQYNQNSVVSSGKGIGISSFKPLSVQNFRPANVHTSAFAPTYPVESNVIISGYRPSIKTLATETQVSNQPIFHGYNAKSSSYQPYQPLPPLSTYPNTVTNIPNFGKPSYIV